VAYYKKCTCGHRSEFESRGMAPRKCGECTRSLLGLSVIEASSDDEAEETELEEEVTEQCPFSLVSMDEEYSIGIPAEGCIIGREAVGAKHLLKYNAISREHIKVALRGHSALTIEDVSRFGSFMNDEPLIKGVSVRVMDGDIIKLYNVPLKVRNNMLGGD
jgi:hypothetical protein